MAVHGGRLGAGIPGAINVDDVTGKDNALETGDGKKIAPVDPPAGATG
jgi:hypothetical protein